MNYLSVNNPFVCDIIGLCEEIIVRAWNGESGCQVDSSESEKVCQIHEAHGMECRHCQIVLGVCLSHGRIHPCIF